MSGLFKHVVKSAIAVLATIHVSTLVTPAHAFGSEGVYLRDISALTLRRGSYTTARRSSAVPQLRCVGGDACHDYVPDVIQCINNGFDGRDVQWKCEASMPDSFRFGATDVTCEGYNSRDDDRVLSGSCGVEYTLHRTSNYYSQHNGGGGGGRYHSSSGYDDSSSSFGELLAGVFFLVFLMFVGFSILSCCESAWNTPWFDDNGDVHRGHRRNRNRDRGWSSGWGTGNWGRGGWGNGWGSGWGNSWGNGWGSGDWGSRWANRGPMFGRGWGSSWFNDNDRYERRGRRYSEPGFWSGMGMGGLGGYFWGRNANANRGRDRYSRYNGHNGNTGGTYFGGGGGRSNGTRRASTTHTATGYGTTRRR